MRVRLADVVLERTPTGILVCDARRGVVHRVTGPAADRLAAVVDHGEVIDDEVTAGLELVGIVERVGISRRSAVAAIAGITTLMLPTAVAAASTGVPVAGGGATTTTTTTTTVALPPAPTYAPELSATPSSKKLYVFWEPIEQPFNYTWSVYSVSGSVTLLASGTAAASDSNTHIYTVPGGVTTVRIDLASITSTVISASESFTFSA